MSRGDQPEGLLRGMRLVPHEEAIGCPRSIVGDIYWWMIQGLRLATSVDTPIAFEALGFPRQDSGSTDGGLDAEFRSGLEAVVELLRHE